MMISSINVGTGEYCETKKRAEFQQTQKENEYTALEGDTFLGGGMRDCDRDRLYACQFLRVSDECGGNRYDGYAFQ